MTATVAVNGVDKRYGKVEAVRDVSFDLASGAAQSRWSATTAPARPR